MAVSVRDRTCKRPAKLMAGARRWARRWISPLATSAVLVRRCQLPWIVTSSGFMEGMDGPETLSQVAYPAGMLVVPKGCDPPSMPGPAPPHAAGVAPGLWPLRCAWLHAQPVPPLCSSSQSSHSLGNTCLAHTARPALPGETEALVTQQMRRRG